MDISNKTVHYAGVNALRLEWLVEQSFTYGVVINFEEEEEESNEVKYVLKVTRLKPGPEGQPLFQIDRTSDVFINETLPDLVADRLAYVAGKVFYPLVISVDNNGGFESIYNHKEIRERWPAVKHKILNDFEGSLVEDYVIKMERQISNPDCIQIAFLNNDWFLHTFFKPIYKEYGAGYTTESIYKFPIVRDFRIDGYLTEEKLSADTNSFGAIELLQKGTVLLAIDEGVIGWRASGSYDGYYVLHPKSKRIVSVVSDFTYEEQLKTKIKVKIFLVPEDGREFDDDFVLDTNVAPASSSGMVILDGPSRKGFWDRLLNK